MTRFTRKPINVGLFNDIGHIMFWDTLFVDLHDAFNIE